MKKVDFKLLKCLLLFFPREAGERVLRRASRNLCTFFTLLRGWVGGSSPECLNGRWLPKKEKNCSSLYKSRDEVSPDVIPPFKQLYKIVTSSIQWIQQFIRTCAHVWTVYWMSNCITGDGICWLFNVSKRGWGFKGLQCSVPINGCLKDKFLSSLLEHVHQVETFVRHIDSIKNGQQCPTLSFTLS